MNVSCIEKKTEELKEKVLDALLKKVDEASLTELAAMMAPPITKPAMNHRLKKLVQLAQEAEK